MAEHDLRINEGETATFATLVDLETEPVNLLDELRGELAKPVQREPLKLTVPNRPNITLMFNPSITFEQYQTWVKKSTPKKDETPDFMKLAAIVLSMTTSGFMYKGKQMFNSKGEPWLLTSPELHDLLGVSQGATAQAIRVLFGSDGHAIQAMKKVIEAAGFSLDGDVQEADESDPLAGL